MIEIDFGLLILLFIVVFSFGGICFAIVEKMVSSEEKKEIEKMQIDNCIVEYINEMVNSYAQEKCISLNYLSEKDYIEIQKKFVEDLNIYFNNVKYKLNLENVSKKIKDK